MTNYKTKRIIDGKPPLRTVIVDENGKVINKNPTKEELKGIQSELYKEFKTVFTTKICCDCKSNDTYIDSRGYENWHKCKCQRTICTKYLCHTCYGNDYNRKPGCGNSLKKEIANFRTNNENPNHSSTKGRKSQKLACRLYGWKDLNEENDNSPIDCYDPKTKLYHQVKIAYYNLTDRIWTQNFENEHNSIRRGFKFKSLILFCASEDGKIINMMYEFPYIEIEKRINVCIHRDIIRGPHWYEKYRKPNEDELMRSNDIWKKINL